MLDQGELEHAGPRPQLADAEWCDGLIGVDEPVQPQRVESGVAVTEQLDRHRIDAGGARKLACGQLRQLTVVACRKVMANFAHLTFQQMEVVEQPFSRGGKRLATPHVAGEDAIGMPEYARVVGQASQQARRAATRIAGERESSGQRPGALLQALDSEQFAVQGTGVEADQPVARPARV